MKNKTQNIIPLFIASLFLSTCYFNKNINQEKIPKEIIVGKITCNNLSENLADIGSKNDEIVLFVYEVNNSGNAILKWHSCILVFEREEELIIGKNILLNKNQLVFVMVEIDTDRKPDEINTVLLKAINAGFEKEPVPNLLREKIKEAILDDDLLGIEKLDFTENKKQEVIKFWGIHLMDEYEYEVTIGF